MKTTFQAVNCTVIHYTTKKDTNGNPRRLYGVYCFGETIAVLDEGHLGSGALDEPWGRDVGEVLRHNIAMDVEITPSEYRKIRFRYPSRDYRNTKVVSV